MLGFVYKRTCSQVVAIGKEERRHLWPIGHVVTGRIRGKRPTILTSNRHLENNMGSTVKYGFVYV